MLFASAPHRQYPALKTYIQLAQASQHCLSKVVSRLMRSDEHVWVIWNGTTPTNMEFWKSLESWQMPFVPATPSSPWMTKSFQPSDQNPKQFLMKGVEPLLDERDSIALRASQQADWSAWVSCNQFFCVICRLKCLRALAEFDSALTCLLLLCCLLLFAKVPC